MYNGLQVCRNKNQNTVSYYVLKIIRLFISYQKQIKVLSCVSVYYVNMLQNGNICYCGNAYGKYGRVNPNACWLRCAGNANIVCGGNGYNNIFRMSE